MADTPSLHVSGNELVDDYGNAQFLKGVNVSYLESQPNLYAQALNNVQVAIGPNWQAKIIRLPISQDRWEGYEVADVGSYRQTAYDIVQAAADAGVYVIIDLHWSDLNVWGQNLSQHNMPDDNTTTAWQDIANDSHFKGHANVFFGVYNEPHDAGYGDANWPTWLGGSYASGAQLVNEAWNGGTVTYETPGIQGLINTIRGTGADNVLFVGGLDYAYDLTQVANGNFVPYDPGGRGIVYDAHIYPFYGNNNKPAYVATDIWDQYVTVEAAHAPVFIGEYGTQDLGETQDGANWIGGLQSWAQSHAYSGGFCGTAAWAFNYGQGAGNLLQDETNYYPTQYEGYTVQYYLTH